MFQRDPGLEERRLSRFPAAPFRVTVPSIPVVEPDSKVRVSAAATDLVRLKKVVEPLIVWPVPSRVTVPFRAVKMSRLVKSPATVMA